MAIFEKNGKWYIDYYFGGKRIRECVGTSKKLAKQALEARKGEIAQERFGLKKFEQRIKFEDFSKDYLEFSRSYKRSHKRDVQHIGHLLEHFLGKFLDEISPAFIEKYKQARVRKVKPATVNRELACLSHMFNTAIRWKLADKNPMANVRSYREELPPLRFLSSDEADRLIEQCSSWLKPIVIAALHTGMRFREILDLEWRHTDLELGVITVIRTKSGESRVIPINPYLAEILSKQPSTSPYVFPNEEGKPFNNIHKGFYAAVRRAKLGHVRFHDLRHTFASHLVMSGVDLVTVKELLGHKDIKMTMRYAHLSNEHKRSALQRLLSSYGHYMDTKLKVVSHKSS